MTNIEIKYDNSEKLKVKFKEYLKDYPNLDLNYYGRLNKFKKILKFIPYNDGEIAELFFYNDSISVEVSEENLEEVKKLFENWNEEIKVIIEVK